MSCAGRRRRRRGPTEATFQFDLFTSKIIHHLRSQKAKVRLPAKLPKPKPVWVSIFKQLSTDELRLPSTMGSCWICLDDRAGQHGKPPVRDCSCKGDNAGFAHVSCIVEYARRKSIEEKEIIKFVAPWTSCENCKQNHLNQLGISLLVELERFVEEQYPGCNWRRLAVQRLLLAEIHTGAEISKEKRDEIIDTTVSIVDHLSICPDLSIEQYQLQNLMSGALNMIGKIRLSQEDLTEDEAKKYLGYLEEDRKTRESISHAMSLAEADETIAYFKARCIERFGITGTKDRDAT
jgi:hypothetical protein